MPARVSSSVHGFVPGVRGMRSGFEQLFVAEPMLTYMAPSRPIAKLRVWCAPEAGRPCTIVSGGPLGLSSPAFIGYRTIADVRPAPPGACPRGEFGAIASVYRYPSK